MSLSLYRGSLSYTVERQNYWDKVTVRYTNRGLRYIEVRYPGSTVLHYKTGVRLENSSPIPPNLTLTLIFNLQQSV